MLTPCPFPFTPKGPVAVEEFPQAKLPDTESLCFVQGQFPKRSSEYRSDYCPVGDRSFRINFWSYKDDSPQTLSRESAITRSLFVHLNKDDLGYTVGQVFEK